MVSMGILVALVLSIMPAAFATEVMQKETQILYEYTEEEIAKVAPTMEDIMNEFSKEDVAAMISVDKARTAPMSYQYKSYKATDEDIEKFYAEVYSILEDYPYGNWYFSHMYWQRRAGFTTLSLEPSKNMDGMMSITQAAAAWAVVKGTVSSSRYWGNENGMKDQFDCHALGEVLLDVGTWDLEVERPDVGYIMTVLAKCNPVSLSIK